jgi:hypothetical protein
MIAVTRLIILTPSLSCAAQRFGRDPQVPIEYGVADIHSVLLRTCRPGGRESFPSETARFVPRTQDKAAPHHGIVSSGDGRGGKLFDWRNARDREARQLHQMASDRVQDRLAMEIAQTRSSAASERSPRIGIPDGG